VRPESIPTAALGGLCGVLAIGLALELLLPVSRVSVAASPGPALAALGSTTAFKPAAMQSLTERPLFAAARRPQSAEPAAQPATTVAPAPPPEPATQLTLLGIVDSPTAKVALIRIGSAKAPIRAVEGAKVDRWEVRRIAADHVTLAAAGTEQELGFPKGANHGAAGAPTIKH
jgi:hypothetical protein